MKFCYLKTFALMLPYILQLPKHLQKCYLTFAYLSNFRYLLFSLIIKY